MIKKIILISLISIVLVIVLVGCQKTEELQGGMDSDSIETDGITSETIPGISIESEIAGIDSLDNDLNMDDLEGIESELDEINW